jgi:hypothetical protein
MITQKLRTYQDMGKEIFNSVGPTIGIHVMLLVFEHSLWLVKQKNEKAALIQFSEEGLFFDELEAIDSEEAQIICHDFLMAIVATLGRLVGKQLAQQLIEQLQLKGDGTN